MKIRFPRLFKKSNPEKPKKSKFRYATERIFGFEKPDTGKFHKSLELNEEEVIVALARLQVDLNWVKRILWLTIICIVSSQFIRG